MRAISPDSGPEKEGPRLATDAAQAWNTEGRTLNLRGQSVKHPFRLLLAKLPWPLSELAWLGLPNPKRAGWRAE